MEAFDPTVIKKIENFVQGAPVESSTATSVIDTQARAVPEEPPLPYSPTSKVGTTTQRIPRPTTPVRPLDSERRDDVVTRRTTVPNAQPEEQFEDEPKQRFSFVSIWTGVFGKLIKWKKPSENVSVPQSIPTGGKKKKTKDWGAPLHLDVPLCCVLFFALDRILKFFPGAETVLDIKWWIPVGVIGGFLTLWCDDVAWLNWFKNLRKPFWFAVLGYALKLLLTS